MKSLEELTSEYWNSVYTIDSKMGVSGIFERIDTISDIFSAFIDYGEEFYDKYIPFEECSKSSMEHDEFTDSLIKSHVYKLYFTIPAFLIYMRDQEEEYVEYVKEIQIKPLYGRLEKTVNIDKQTLHKIYAFEAADLINDLYLTLKYVAFVLESFEELLQPDCDPIEILRNNESYKHISLNKRVENLHLVSLEEMKEEFKQLHRTLEDLTILTNIQEMKFNKIKWLGTSTELAYLFEQLAYRGYIDNPQTKDGDMNKSAFAREVWQHIAPESVKEETFIVDLRGSRLSENSTFARALNSIPTNNKTK